MNRNIAHYVAIKNNSFTVSTATKLIDLIETSNPGWKESLGKRFPALNSFRLYVGSGDVGIRLDGPLATETTSLVVAEGQHFIENCDLAKVSLVGVGGDAEVALFVAQIG